MKLVRTAFRLLLLFTLAGLFSGCMLLTAKRKPTLPQPEEMYNVLYITAESMNIKHLDVYNWEVYGKRPVKGKHTSDDLTLLVRKGTMFSRCASASCWTSENMVSFMTGMWPPTHQVDTRGKHLAAEWYAPLERLRDIGYTIPRMQGFQADENQSHLGFVGPEVHMSPEQWLEENQEKPFFMWFHILHTHLPYNPKKWAKDRFWSDELSPNPESLKRVLNVSTNGVLVKGTVDFKPEEDAPALHALYNGEVLRMSEKYAHIVKKLEELGLRDKTIIVFGADHGEELLEHGFVGHASTSHDANLHDEVTYIPLIISFPKKVPQFKVIKHQVRGVDIMPTIYDLLGLPPLEQFQGKSLVPMMQDEETESRTAYISTSKAGYKEEDPDNIREYRRAVRSDKWKLIVHIEEGVDTVKKLYDMENDPLEQSEVSAAHPEVVAELTQQIRDWEVYCAGWRKEHVKGKNVDPAFRIGWLTRIKRSLFPPKPLDLTGVPSPPSVTLPVQGTVLTAASTKGTVEIEWTGSEKIPYVIEVAAGKGDYYFSNQIKVKGNRLVRTFQESYWDEFITDYDPARVRVRIDEAGQEWSDWVNVRLQ